MCLRSLFLRAIGSHSLLLLFPALGGWFISGLQALDWEELVVHLGRRVKSFFSHLMGKCYMLWCILGVFVGSLLMMIGFVFCLACCLVSCPAPSTTTARWCQVLDTRKPSWSSQLINTSQSQEFSVNLVSRPSTLLSEAQVHPLIEETWDLMLW